ncbi:MAG: FimV/HubP family polar landmark protein [Burkholderiales bacterium]
MVKRLDRAAAAALILLFGSASAQAAGLGRLTVLSDLGQPFRAEIELVSVKKDELSSLKARLASPDAFRQADLPYTAYVSGLRLSVENRPNGEPYVKISGPQPLNEPFIDFLVELNSTGGRIVRSYTALVDPPPVGDADTADAAKAKSAAQAAEVKPDAAAAKPSEPAPVPLREPVARTESEPAPVASRKESAPPVDAAAPVEAPTAGTKSGAAMKAKAPAGEYGPVKKGDTLGKIARATKPADVTLEQMLVLLYRANPDAFIGKNMNLLKAGKVLRVPDAAEAADLTAQAASKEVKVQAANWKAYREKLAAAAEAGPAMEDAKGRSATGKTTTALEERAPAPVEPPKEVLKLSKGAPPQAGKDMGAKDRTRALEEEVSAKSKAVSESNQRIAQLEKQLKDMQSLAEMKSKGLAEAQKPVAPPPALPKAVEPPPPVKPVAPPEKPLAVGPKPMGGAEKPLEAGPKPLAPADKPLAVGPKPLDAGPKPLDASPKPMEAGPKPLDKAPEPTTPPMAGTEPSKPETPPAAATATPAEPPVPLEPPKPKKKYALPPPPPAPSLLDQVLGNPLLLAGGGAIVAALAGLGFMGWKRKRESANSASSLSTQLGRGARKDEEADESYEDTMPAGLAAVAGTAAVTEAGSGQPPAADESDALAEAEVFLIYGRDAQAEERLKEAIAVTPERYELHAKLLEIYAKRNDPTAFEPVAKELQMGTGGEGDLWDKAVRLGYQIDPSNPRYAAGRPEDSTFENTMPGIAAESTVQMPAFDGKPADDLDFNLDFDTTNSGSATDIDLENLGAELSGSSGTSTTTDIDLGMLGAPGDVQEIVDPTKTMASSAESLQQSSQMLAFDPTATLAPPDTGDLPTLPGVSIASATAKPAEPPLDLDLGLDTDNTDSDRTVSGAGGADEVALSFDLDTLKLDSPPLASGGANTAGSNVPDLDLSTISLNLGDTESTVAPTGRDEKWYDVQTKFDLAKAYQEMGDKDGAREILQEVIAEGDADQKAAAEKLMGSLG